MSDIVIQHNIGALVDVVYASAAAAATAGGTGDATTTTGATIDRAGLSNGSLPASALFSTIYDATLASGATMTIALAVQDSADGSTWADYQTAAAVTVGTGPSGGGAVKGALNTQVDLGSARRYVRLNTKPDLSAANTDTAVTRSVAVLAGFDRLAAPN
jgi:hypothetical protein